MPPAMLLYSHQSPSVATHTLIRVIRKSVFVYIISRFFNY